MAFNTCPICGKHISRSAKHCQKCNNKLKKVSYIDRYTKEERDKIIKQFRESHKFLSNFKKLNEK